MEYEFFVFEPTQEDLLAELEAAIIYEAREWASYMIAE